MTDQSEETGSERVVGTDLTTVVEYNETTQGLAELRHKHGNVVFNVTVPKEMKAAKEVRAELVKLRTGLEAKRKDLKAPMLERGKLLDNEAKRITDEIKAIEEPIDVQIKLEEARAEQIKLEKLEAERLRVEAINKRIDEIRNVPASLVGKPAVIIQGQLARLKADELSEDEFQEHFVTARDAHTAAIARIEQLLQAQLEVDEEKKRQAQRDADMKAMQDRLDAQQKLIDYAAAAAKAAAERVASEAAAAEKEKQEAEAAEQRQREAAERERVEEIRGRINWFAVRPKELRGAGSAAITDVILNVKECLVDEEDYAEFLEDAVAAKDSALSELRSMLQRALDTEKAAAEAQAAREAEELRQQAERDRQAAEQKKLDAQAAKLKREKAEAARKAEELRLASLGLRDAAQALVDYCDQEEPQFDQVNQLINDLRSALANDAAQAKPARTKKAANA
jgi:colicin import membrane protein